MRSAISGHPTKGENIDMAAPVTNVALDAVGIHGGGGHEVVLDVVRVLAEEAPEAQVVLFGSDTRLLAEAAELTRLRAYAVPAAYVYRAYWWWGGAGRAARAEGCRALLHLANVGSGDRGMRTAVLVHQPNAVFADPGHGRSLAARTRYATLRQLIRHTCHRVDEVFVQSPYVKEQLRALAPQAARITVALPRPPSSLADTYARPQPHDVDQPTRFVYIGSRAPHKNLALLEAAALQLGARLPGAAFVLTVDGPDGSAGPLRHTGPLDRMGVRALLHTATAVVMPSWAETVGLPMLEAMAAGVPVLAADLPYAHAICEDAALYFDPREPAALVDACTRVARSGAVHAALVRAGRARIRELARSPGDRVMARWLVGR